jgi:glucose/arabinose dehydrogenase
MPRRLLAVLGSVSMALVVGQPVRSATRSAPAAIGAVVVAGDLAFPAAFTFAPDGRIFYGERGTGEIRIFDPSSGTDTLFFTIPNVVFRGEQGLLGLALHPQYPTRPAVYAYATREVGGTFRNQIIRIQDQGGVGTGPKLMWSSDTVAGAYHDGGRILFGPDGMLYVLVGEGHLEANSQNLDNDAGKILRITDRGQIPPDNPFPGKRIWAYGIRNGYGMAFDPLTGNLWEEENGPQCNDETNLIVKGANLGWGPSETCDTPPPPPENTNQDGPSPVLPVEWFTPVIAPVGNAFCVGCGLSNSEGTLFFGAYLPMEIRRATMSADRLDIVSIETVYAHDGFVLSMERGPDGSLYFSDPRAIYRLVES